MDLLDVVGDTVINDSTANRQIEMFVYQIVSGLIKHIHLHTVSFVILTCERSLIEFSLLHSVALDRDGFLLHSDGISLTAVIEDGQ